MARRGGLPYGRGTGRPNPVDVYVGARVRLRRTLLGMSQEKLGEAMGLTFQQVQKYERGANIIGASRLFDLCRILDVPIGFFFDEMPAAVTASSPAQSRGISEEPASYELDPLAKRETLMLARAYFEISDPQVRKRVFEMLKSLGAAFKNRDR